MPQEQFDTLLQFFKVLANESRLKILGLLANDERSVGELAALLEVKEPTVSHHLAMMKGMGLVDVRAEGNVRIYCLNSKSLEDLSRDVFVEPNLATLVSDEPTDAWEQKVLRSYLDGERLKDIPLKRKKRLVILNWVVEKFDWDRHYPEKELSEMLTAYHPDYASLRRYMIEEKLMAREKGIYWRI